MPNKLAENAKRLRGTYRPDRDKPRTPDSGSIGEPPKHLDREHAALWKQLAASLPAGLGMPSDRTAFELLTRLTAQMREGDMKSGDIAQMRSLMESFALTPSGRRRLNIPDAPKPRTAEERELDEFDD